jgi:carbamoyl-phosphate synthase large subunit
VNLIVPTIDPELPIYARHRERFLAQGIAVAIGDEKAVQIASDKWNTYQWLCASGLPTARTALAEEVLNHRSSWPLPFMVKPRCGSASVGVTTISHFSELERAVHERKDLIVQEIAQGIEYTINLYLDLSGKCIASVPHRRIQTRGGEVAKGITTKNPALIELGRRVAEQLPGMRGAMNVQCFLSAAGHIRIIELNARFGGGYPLAHQAGAPFTHWLIEETLGRRPEVALDSWKDQLMMVRYDQELFLEAQDAAYVL